MASDTQYTGRFREKGNKTWELRDNMILGCAGFNTYNYLFWRRLRDAFDKKADITLPDRIDLGIHSYNSEIHRRNKVTFYTKGEIDYRCYPEAIVAGYDEGLSAFVMFKVNPPDSCEEVEYHNLRAAVGTGGDAATVFLKTIEDVMGQQGVEYSELSWRLIAQLSYVLLHRISFIDPHSSGTTILRLKRDDYDVLKRKDIFRGTTYSSQFSEFIGLAIEEVGSKRVGKFLKDLGIPDMLGRALGGGSS